MARAAKRTPRKKRAKLRLTSKPEPGKDAELVKMSELAKRSGVPGPTIKHYIREGLLPGPEVRTSKNMAYYDARIASRIRVIKELQADRFLPLRVIAELLEPAPSDRIKADREAAQRKALQSVAPVVEDRAATMGGSQRRKRSEVQKLYGVSKAELDGLEKAGVLELRGEGDTAGYSGIDLELLDILADVHRLGLESVFPISVAEPYMAAVKKLAEFEIDVFRHRVLSAGLPPNLPEVAGQAVELGERLIIALRAKVLPNMLQLLGVNRS
jgi:DNA-binding transcriptional MerR regulator